MKDIYDGTIGLVIGDAMGVPVELHGRKSQKRLLYRCRNMEPIINQWECGLTIQV